MWGRVGTFLNDNIQDIGETYCENPTSLNMTLQATNMAIPHNDNPKPNKHWLNTNKLFSIHLTRIITHLSKFFMHHTHDLESFVLIFHASSITCGTKFKRWMFVLIAICIDILFIREGTSKKSRVSFFLGRGSRQRKFW